MDGGVHGRVRGTFGQAHTAPPPCSSPRGSSLLARADPLDLDVEIASDALRPDGQVGEAGEERGRRAVLGV